MELLIIVVFIVGYLGITLEHSIKLDKFDTSLGYDGHLLGNSSFRY